MSEPVFQQEPTDDVPAVESPSPAIDPLQALQRIASNTDQPAAQAAATALDALVKFLEAASPADPAAAPLPQPVARASEPTSVVTAPVAPAVLVPVEPVVAPVTSVVVPVEPAAEPEEAIAPATAVVVAAAVAVPFWKRELSLGKKKEKATKNESEKPKKTKNAKNKKDKQATPAVAATAKPVPFWKRGPSIGGKKQKQAAVATAAVAVAAASTDLVGEPKPSVPFWRRELSFGKSKSKTAKVKTPKTKSSLKEKTPFLKREIKVDLAGIANMPIGHQDGTTEGLDKLVGLRIGSSQLAAALVSNNGHAELEQIARTPLRSGLVVDGEVMDADGLASALKSFFAQNKLPKRGVRIGVSTNRIGVRVMEVPALDDEKAAANAIRFRAQEVLPFPLSEAVLDHVDLGEGPNDTRRVLIAFAHKALIDQYVDACKRAKLKLAGIDFDAFALLRAVAAKREEGADRPTAALVALAIGHERTIFAVSDGEICEFTRVLDWGGGAVDNAIAESLLITPEEAEKVKLELSMTGEPAHPDLTPEEVEKARGAVRDSLQLLARELVASLQFYQSRTGSLDIGDVLVTGGGAGLLGLDAELTRMLGVSVRTADPFAAVTVGPDVEVPEQTGSLVIAVGLAIEDQH